MAPSRARWSRSLTRMQAAQISGIREDKDGLIMAAADGVALTWMDARVGDWVVTPRRGKPVEINALWYNARRILADLHIRCGRLDEAKAVRRAADVTRRAFVRAFWDPSTESLVDVIRPDGTADRSVRPNQLFAASLPFPLLTRRHARAMVDLVERELVTPRGLRTLAPSDPAYIGRYQGDQHERDAAYHQGTVWPWLIGPFADAVRYVEGRSPIMTERLRAVLASFAVDGNDACVGHVSEVFDGDEPQRPGGCPAQAWSVAEVLRAWSMVSERSTKRRRTRVTK